jgi:hypothetical protein
VVLYGQVLYEGGSTILRNRLSTSLGGIGLKKISVAPNCFAHALLSTVFLVIVSKEQASKSRRINVKRAKPESALRAHAKRGNTKTPYKLVLCGAFAIQGYSDSGTTDKRAFTVPFIVPTLLRLDRLHALSGVTP